MKTNRERDSQYFDNLGRESLDKINKLSLPWQKNFLCRFYEQLHKQRLKKIDVANRINKGNIDKYDILPPGHTLPPNTLTQYTNFNRLKINVIDVNNLIAVSSALGVSINYLLGIDSCENPENTDINKATGLSNETIDIIKRNDGLQKKLNHFLLSPNLNDIEMAIDTECYMHLIYQDILNVYSTTLLEKIKKAYQRFVLEIFPLDQTLEKYQDYLYMEIPFKELQGVNNTKNSIIDYLESNLSSDVLNQIQLNAQYQKKFSEKDIYTVFISDTAQRTYEIMEQKHNKTMRMNKIAQAFLSLLDDYIIDQVKETKSRLKESIKKKTTE